MSIVLIPECLVPVFRGQFRDNDVRDRAIYIYGCSYVVLDGLIATNSYHHGIRIESVSNVTVKNCVAYYSGGRAGDNSAGIGVLYSNSNNVTVKACSTYSIYSYPFSPSTYDINTDGICVYRCRECTIDSNVVFDIAPGAPAIRMKWLDTLCTVSNNTVFNCYDGISVGPQCSQNSVYGNIIYDISWDGISIKATNNLGENNITSVYNNTLYNCGNGGIKTYPESIVRDASIWNNLVINSHAGSVQSITISLQRPTIIQIYIPTTIAFITPVPTLLLIGMAPVTRWRSCGLTRIST